MQNSWPLGCRQPVWCTEQRLKGAVGEVTGSEEGKVRGSEEGEVTGSDEGKVLLSELLCRCTEQQIMLPFAV